MNSFYTESIRHSSSEGKNKRLKKYGKKMANQKRELDKYSSSTSMK